MTEIVLLTGGSTPEREVALAGAAQVVAALRRRSFAVTVVDTCSGPLTRDDEARLLSGAVDRRPPSPRDLERLAAAEDLLALAARPELRACDAVFLLLHGRQGEGGRVQAILEEAGIAYTGSDATGSMLAMDKDVAKRLMVVAGVPTPPWRLWPVSEAEVAALGFPVVVKASRVGSTVGLSVVRSWSGMEAAVEEARRYDDSILVERFVPGRELTVGILEDRALAVGEIITPEGIFDYESKYQPGGAREVFPADLDDARTREVQEVALRVHRALGLRHFSRVDFRLDPGGGLYCLEANTLPGMTGTSLLPQSAAAAGLSFDDLCQRLVELARDDRRHDRRAVEPEQEVGSS
jgi:D-alanine-D-alanine ligase